MPQAGILIFLFLGLTSALAQTNPLSATAGAATRPNPLRGLTYAVRQGIELKLDLYFPARPPERPAPLLIWIHGGGFTEGSRTFCPIAPLAEEGYAVASISYRLSRQATFPAQIEDAKAAVRWMRAHAAEYNLAPDRFGACGESAGGLLAALLGTASDVPTWGDGPAAGSSRVQAVAALCPPTDLTLDDPEQARVPELLRSADPKRVALGREIASRMKVLTAALGGPPSEHRELAREMSPLTHVSPDDPPFMLVHGDRDRLVPLSQSVALQEALLRADVPVELVVVPGAGHGFGRPKPDLMARIKTFFDAHLK